ncbi:SCO2524 family protein [Catenulispora yoronensis]|uniref:SCO2524 family protein n=2 Tax=Catenulispora yoronensis TaxID=450799 RepID=A0ABP5GK90_9ACTN
MLAECFVDGKWVWGGRVESNPISDAEQLLCLLYPITQIDTFAVHDPDSTQRDVLRALRPFGDASNLPRTLVEIATDYFIRHTDEEGEPRFAAGSYLRSLNPDDPVPEDERLQQLEVVDGYSMSITLCLSLLLFVNDRERMEARSAHVEKLVDLRARASRRLTSAMVGLLRSFVVNSVGSETNEGRAILQMLNQGPTTDAELQQNLRNRFERLRNQLKTDVRLGVEAEAMPDEDQLFECGWTWGIAKDAKIITEYAADIAISSQQGYAQPRPWLYFTVSALDGIVDLTSRRIRTLNIFTDEQRSLADALALRWELTQRYWSAVARFDAERWPLEDIPWRTSDGQESDYYSLLVVSVVIQDLIARTATDADLVKAVRVIEDLARRGRITSRFTENDRAAAMHFPGVAQGLVGSEDVMDARLALYTTDFTPLVIKRSLQAAFLTDDVETREALMVVAEAAMDQLDGRRLIRDGQSVDLWDDVGRMLPGTRGQTFDRPSWYLTERVVEALVATANTYQQDTPRDPAMYDHLLRLLNEADHIYNQELLRSDVDDRSSLRDRLGEIGGHIARARELRQRRTSTAIALVERALRLLDLLAEADADASRSR